MTIYKSGGTDEGKPTSSNRGRTIAGIALAVIMAFVTAIASGAGEFAWIRISDWLGLARPSPSEQQTVSSEPTAASAAPSAQQNAAAPVDPITIHVYNVKFRGDTLLGDVVVTLAATDRRITIRGTGLGDGTAGGAVQACPIRGLGNRDPTGPCQELVASRNVTLSDVDKVQVRLSAEVANTKVRTVDELAFTYRPASGSLQLALPDLRQGEGASLCKDNFCNPFVEITPFHSGRVSASATWASNGNARLLIEAGRVAAHAYAAYGETYQIIDSAESNGQHTAEVDGMVFGKEYAIAVLSVNGLLGELVLQISWSAT